MAIRISGTTGIDMGNTSVSNASQVEVQEEQVTPFSGFKNYIINGGFDIDQRNNKAGFIIVAGGSAFSADRWMINNTSNQPVYITVAEFPTPSGGRVGRLRIKFDTAPTSGVIQIFQRIENVAILGGKQVTLSHSFDCDAMTITNDATQNFGSGGSSNVATSFSNIYTTGILSSLTRFSSSITLPSVDGKTIGTGSYTQIAYSLPIRTTNIQTITQVQLEEGSVATPFENRPIGLELSLCQRYFQLIRQRVIESRAASEFASISTTLPVVLRTSTPIVTLVATHSSGNIGSNIIAVSTNSNLSRQIAAAVTGIIDSDLTYSLATEL